MVSVTSVQTGTTDAPAARFNGSELPIRDELFSVQAT